MAVTHGQEIGGSREVRYDATHPARQVRRISFVRLYGLALTCLLAVSCETPDRRRPDDSTSLPIFRYVQLANGRVVLGEPVPAPILAAVSMQGVDTVISLPRDTFGDAERIVLHLTPGGVVRGIVFDYPHGIDFEAKVGEYAALGAPVRTREQRAGEEPADVVTWQDEHTTFSLRRDPNRSAWTIRAELRDRDLSARSR